MTKLCELPIMIIIKRPVMSVRNFLSKQLGKYFKYRRKKYVPDLKACFPGNPTIISNNCLAGFIYQDCDRSYQSPTAGLYFFFPDFIEFLSDLENNLKAKIEFVSHSKYDLGNERIRNAKHKYPVGLLAGKYEIHFLHYENEEEALQKWKRRVERVNLNNLIVLGIELDLCTQEDIKKFDKLPFKNKIFLTRTALDLPSVVFIKEFEKNIKIGDPYRNGDLLYKNIITKIKSQKR